MELGDAASNGGCGEVTFFTNLNEVPDTYRAMNQREALEIIVKPQRDSNPIPTLTNQQVTELQDDSVPSNSRSPPRAVTKAVTRNLYPSHFPW